jgi:hypothetical protein
LERSAAARAGRTLWLIELLGDDLDAQSDTLVTDVNIGPGDDLADLLM